MACSACLHIYPRVYQAKDSITDSVLGPFTKIINQENSTNLSQDNLMEASSQLGFPLPRWPYLVSSWQPTIPSSPAPQWLFFSWVLEIKLGSSASTLPTEPSHQPHSCIWTVRVCAQMKDQLERRRFLLPLPLFMVSLSRPGSSTHWLPTLILVPILLYCCFFLCKLFNSTSYATTHWWFNYKCLMSRAN